MKLLTGSDVVVKTLDSVEGEGISEIIKKSLDLMAKHSKTRYYRTARVILSTTKKWSNAYKPQPIRYNVCSRSVEVVLENCRVKIMGTAYCIFIYQLLFETY